MPCSRLNVLAGPIDDFLRVARCVCIVVVRPDLRVQVGRAQSRPDVILCDRRGLVGALIHGNMTIALVVERLVLNGNGIDSDTKLLVGLKILYEVLRILAVVLRVEPVIGGVASENLRDASEQDSIVPRG